MKKKKVDIETASCMAFESLKKQLMHEVKDELTTYGRWRFYPNIFLYSIILGLVLLVSAWEILDVRGRTVRRIEEDLYKKVEKTYDEKNISILVDGLIEEKAENVIKMLASKRIDSIIESEIRPVIIIHDLALKAQQGYKSAYFKLDSIANIEGYEYAELSRDIVSEIYGNVINYAPRIIYTGRYSNEEVIERLSDQYINVREMAVCSIGERKIYNQIPRLIAMLETEKNLYVLAAITYVLNQSFSSRVSIFESDFINKYEQLWRTKRNELIEKN